MSEGSSVRLCGLWARDGKNGTYFAGRLSGAKIVVAANRNRKSDDDPSHYVYLVESPSPSRQNGAQTRSGAAPAYRRDRTPELYAPPEQATQRPPERVCDADDDPPDVEPAF